MQTPSQRPPMKPSLKQAKTGERASSDDLSSVKAVDEADSRARAALSLMNDEHEARLTAEADRRALEEQLKVLAAQPVVVHAAKSESPGHVQLAYKSWKFAVPFTVLATLIPVAWSTVQYVTGLIDQVKTLNTAVAGYEKGKESQDAVIATLQAKVGVLDSTMQRMSGYIAGALPMAGVSVPGAEAGAIQVHIDRDPDPTGTKRKPMVVTHTRVPSPPPQ